MHAHTKFAPNEPTRKAALGAIVAALSLPGCAARVAGGFALALVWALPAGSTDISNLPIHSTTVTPAKPNIMLLMDTSKSILFTHAPNALEVLDVATGLPAAAQPIGYRANQCNSIYYNPATPYQVPVDSSGTALKTASELALLFGAAPYNHFTPGTSSGSAPNNRATVDLNTQFQAFDRNTRALNTSGANDEEQRAYYYVYKLSGGSAPAVLNYAAAPCTDAYGTLPSTAIPTAPTPAGTYGNTDTPGGYWQRVLVGPMGTPGVTIDETQNFAIWYSFYRTRISLTKSGIGLAFSRLGQSPNPAIAIDVEKYLNYRVGFVNGNPLTKPGGNVDAAGDSFTGANVDPDRYLALAPFTQAQRDAWYTKMYAQVPGGSSPMREGLARVGRHYAGRDDGINKGMTLQATTDDRSCRQNFTIMTTGGYWSRKAETAGPVQVDGTSLVGEQDGVVDATVTVNGITSPISPRPIWDGGSTGFLDTTDVWNSYSAASCDTHKFVKSTTQVLRSTTQMLRRTSQPLRSTKQLQMTTAQITRATSQLTKSTSQRQMVQTQMTATTTAVTRSTFQQRKVTTQYLSSTLSPTRQTQQTLYSTSFKGVSTTQVKQSTTQMRRSTLQNMSSTSTVARSTSQWLTSWQQLQLSTSQATQSTQQTNWSSTQYLRATYAATTNTSQWFARDSEGSTPVVDCTSTLLITCTLVTGPVTPIEPNTAPCGGNHGAGTWKIDGTQANDFVATVCVNTNAPATGVATLCASQPGNQTPFEKIVCSTDSHGPTPMAATSCVQAAAVLANGYISVSCPVTTGASHFVPLCTPVDASGANGWTATLCTNDTPAPIGVGTCANDPATSANDYKQTICTTVTHGPTGAPSACPATSGSASVSPFVVTSCWQDVHNDGNVQSCTPSDAASTNGWLTTNCTPSTTLAQSVLSCSYIAPTAANGYATTTCSQNTSTLVPVSMVPVSTCSTSAATALNDWVKTTCTPNNTSLVPVSSCAVSGPTFENGYTDTSCTPNNTSGGAASCTDSGPTSANGWVTTTCATPLTSTPVGVDPLTCNGAAASAGNSWVATLCTPNNSAVTIVSSCTDDPGTATNQWVHTVCGTYVSAPVGVQSCTPTATVSCPDATVTDVSVAPNSCTETSAAAPNWIATTCPTVVGATTPVQYCLPIQVDHLVPMYAATYGAGLAWVSSTFSSTGYYSAHAGLMSTGWDNWANNWTQTICHTATPAATPVATCTNVGADSTNNYVATVCAPIVVTTGLSATDICTPDLTPNSGNNYTKTACPTTITGPNGAMPGTCSGSQVAAVGNAWLTIDCHTNTTPYVGVQLCIPPSWDAFVGVNVISNYNAYLAPGRYYGPGGGHNQYVPQPGLDTYPHGNWDVQNNATQTLCGTNNTDATPVAACANAAASASNSWVATSCATPILSANEPVSACQTGTDANFVETTCSTNLTGPTAVSACTEGTDANFVTTICTPNNTSNVPVASCALSGPTGGVGGNDYTTTTCPAPITTGPTEVLDSACVAAATANSGNGYTTTTCDPVAGAKVQYQTTTRLTHQQVSGTTSSAAAVVTSSTAAAVDLDGLCYTALDKPVLFAPSLPFTAGGAPSLDGSLAPGRPPALPSTVSPALTSLTTVGPAPPSPCLAWPCSVSNAGNSTGGSTNSLADVAQYYYATDLRPDLADTVPAGVSSGYPNEDDRLQSQHMTTFVVGLGVSGTLKFTADYPLGTGDFSALRTGLAVSGQGTGATGWPAWPTAATTAESQFNDARSIDDFWHAAVNGRGRFFSANDPASLVSGITGTLEGISSASGSGAGATLETQTPVAGHNAIFTTSFVTGKWTGNVQAKSISASGEYSSTSDWSAQAKLDSSVSLQCDKRDIRLIRTDGTATNKLTKFAWNSQSCDSEGIPTGATSTGLSATEQAFFGSTQVANLSQFGAGSTLTADQATAAAGANLVNYLRGQQAYQGNAALAVNQLYRTRDHALGDIVGSQLAYVAAPSQLYGDVGYSTFVSAQSARTPMAYVGGNDGMLHAFYAPADSTAANAGKEAWAVIPSSVLPNLYALADITYSYAAKHQFYVDGTPTSGDIYNGTAWKTILVGGLNAGGKGYYALDVTDPTTPKALWEFKASSTACPTSDATAATNTADCNLGLTFGRPVITKLADGTWVVLLTSGYNNSTDGGNGQGYLYVLNADTGAIIRRIGTGVGDTGAGTGPSGLRELSTYVSNPVQNNTALRVYGGDLLGNLWRFDINGGATPAVLVTSLRAADGTAQSVTTRINLAEVNGNTFLLVGTGRLLGGSDIGSAQQQTVYSIKDPMGTPALPAAELDPSTLRASLKPVKLTTTGSLLNKDLARTALPCSGTTAQCASTAGWYLDLTQGLNDATLGSERVNVDMELASGTLVFQSNIPSTSQCAPGYNLFNQLDFVSGSSVGGAGVTSFGYATLAVGASLARMPDGAFKWIVTNADGTKKLYDVAVGTPPPVGKRISWREIIVP